MQPIFRQSALKKLSSPEDLDQQLRVTSTRGWLTLAGFAIIVLAAVAWGIFGHISTTVQGKGMMIGRGGVDQVVSLTEGAVTEVMIKAEDTIRVGQVLAKIRDAQGIIRPIISTRNGHVLEVRVQPDLYISRGTGVALVESARHDLTAVTYVPLAQGKYLNRNMEVYLSPSTVRPEDFGYLIGRVEFVSRFPTSPHRMAMWLGMGNDQLIKSLSTEPMVEVNIEIERSTSQSGDFRWTSGRVPPNAVTSGTPCGAFFVTGTMRPISFVIPAAQ